MNKLFILENKKFYINPTVVFDFWQSHGIPPEVFKEMVEGKMKENGVEWVVENTKIVGLT